MNRDLLIMILLLLLNLVVSLTYLLLHLRRKDRKKGVVNFITFLVFPIAGPLVMGLAELSNQLFFQNRQRELLYDELSFSKERMKLIQDTDLEKSLNSVALEEALLLSNKQDRRQSLMEVLKQEDYVDMIGNIKEAVESDDREVSHYAATFVAETAARYKSRERELRQQIKKNPSDENLLTYLQYCNEIVTSGLFTGLEQQRFLLLFDQAAHQLYALAPEILPDRYITTLLSSFQSLKQEEPAKKWLDVIKSRSSTSLECFKTYAASCFAQRDREGFFDLLQQVKNASISLDSEALEWIRYFT